MPRPAAPGDTLVDEHHAWQLATQMTGDVAASDLIERCDRRAADLVARLEAPIRYIAAELLAHSEFVGVEVADLIDRCRQETGWKKT